MDRLDIFAGSELLGIVGYSSLSGWLWTCNRCTAGSTTATAMVSASDAVLAFEAHLERRHG